MKKLLTLFVVTMLAVAIYALPQSNGQNDLAQSMKAKVEAIKAQRIERLTKLSKTTTARTAAAPQPASTKQAAQAQVITLNFDKLDELSYQAETGDWFMQMSCMDVDKAEFGYVLKFDYFASKNSYAGNFTTGDFDHDYSYMSTLTSSVVHYDEIEMTVTSKKMSKNMELLTLTATIVASDGVTYKVNCTHEVIVPAEKVETVINDVVLTYNEWDFTLAGKNNVMDVNLLVKANRVIGNHSTTLDQANSSFVYNGKKLGIMSVEVLIEAKDVEDKFAYVANVKLVGSDTVQYEITMVSPMPAPTYQDVICTNFTIDETLAAQYGNVYLEAKNDDWEVLGVIPGMQAKAGHYTKADGVEFYITNNATWLQVEALKVDVTLEKMEDCNWKLTGTVRCSDNVVYNMDLSYVAPKADKVVEIKFANPSQVWYTPDANHKLEFMNEGEWLAFVEVSGVVPGEPFGVDKVNVGNSLLMNYTTYDMPQIADVNGVVEQFGDTTMIRASLTCFDGVQYDVEMFYAVPAPTKTVVETMDVSINDLIAIEGCYQLGGYNADSTLMAMITPYAEQIPGYYANDGLFGRLGQEGGHYDFFGEHTYIGVFEADRNGYVMNMVMKGEISVTVDAEGNISAKVDVVCDNSVRYILTLTSAAKGNHLDYDAKEGSVERAYTSDDNVKIEQGDGIIYFDVEAADGMDLVSVIFFADEVDEDIIIPVGTYTVNDSEAAGSVLANPGMQGGYVYPSFYGELDEGSLVALYMFVGGTIEVSKNELGKLHIEMNVVNSYDVPVHITYDDITTTAVENVTLDSVQAEKTLQDGQLLINRNGETYNAVGAKL